MEPDSAQSNRLRICLLSPWYGGSHQRWADELREASSHRIDILCMEARHWKWRLHGAAVTLAERYLEAGESYDLILADDMMDVAVFSALLKGKGINTPIACYFHENQISYPVSPRDTDLLQGRDLHYGFINYTSALASDRVYFNSHYHRGKFLEGLPDFLSSFPDYINMATVDAIRTKSEVLPLGMNLSKLDRHRPAARTERDRPLILWNHRWEYDKCPDDFLGLLLQLKEEGLSFEVALLGERGKDQPRLLERAKAELGSAIVQDGPVDTYSEYASWLWRADICPVTAIQDFFGGSVVEAIHCGCHLLLPKRLAYPEHLPHARSFYQDPDELLKMSRDLILSGRWKDPAADGTHVARYDWIRVVACYDEAFSALVYA